MPVPVTRTRMSRASSVLLTKSVLQRMPGSGRKPPQKTQEEPDPEESPHGLCLVCRILLLGTGIGTGTYGTARSMSESMLDEVDSLT